MRWHNEEKWSDCKFNVKLRFMWRRVLDDPGVYLRFCLQHYQSVSLSF